MSLFRLLILGCIILFLDRGVVFINNIFWIKLKLFILIRWGIVCIIKGMFVFVIKIESE